MLPTTTCSQLRHVLVWRAMMSKLAEPAVPLSKVKTAAWRAANRDRWEFGRA
jgi:hypothetical protein